MFCGMLIACVAALQCAFGMRVPSGGALLPPVPGPPASGLRSFCLSLLRAHLSASIFARLRMILEWRGFAMLVRVIALLDYLPPRRLSRSTAPVS